MSSAILPAPQPAALPGNPLLADTVLPPFADIRPEHIEPAIRGLLQELRTRIAALARIPEPTFATVVVPLEYLTPAIEDRAIEVQALLADRGEHRAPSIPDLLIAATAELAQLTVLHLDKDFDVIAALTGQPVERLTH